MSAPEPTIPIAPPLPTETGALASKVMQNGKEGKKQAQQQNENGSKEEADVFKAKGKRRSRKRGKRKAGANVESPSVGSPTSEMTETFPEPTIRVDGSDASPHEEPADEIEFVKSLSMKIATVAKKVDVESEEEEEEEESRSEEDREAWGTPADWEPDEIKPTSQVIRADPQSSVDMWNHMDHSKTRKGGGLGPLSCWCF